jgi:hypothetical protein
VANNSINNPPNMSHIVDVAAADTGAVDKDKGIPEHGELVAFAQRYAQTPHIDTAGFAAALPSDHQARVRVPAPPAEARAEQVRARRQEARGRQSAAR